MMPQDRLPGRMDPLSILEPAATRVRDPLSGRSVWLAGLIQDARIDGDTLRFVLAVKKEHGADDRQRLREALLRNLAEKGWTGEIVCTIRVEGVAAGGAAAGATSAHDHGHGHAHGAAPAPAPPRDALKGMSGPGMQPHGGPITKAMPEGVKRIIAVTSGKGGVGKSTVATNLAVGLAKLGHKVGLLDADIYGPSMPRMLGVTEKPDSADGKMLKPIERYGLRTMSIGYIVNEDTPMIWRGPMVSSALEQMLRDVEWGELDVLVVDMPPGTGDAQLTLAQRVALAGAVIVSTPQDIALVDARKGLNMFRKVAVPVLGIVENMSYFLCPKCGERSEIFGHGGAREEAEKLGVPFLGEVPLHLDIRTTSDSGRPIVIDKPDSPHTQVYKNIAGRVWKQLSANQRGARKAPTIVVR